MTTQYPSQSESRSFSQVKDSGQREEFDTGSRRDTEEGKFRPDLIPEYLKTRLGQHYTNGAAKYGDDNWKLGQPIKRYKKSLDRHLAAFERGDTDEDHESAIIWNMISIMWTREAIRLGILPKDLDDYALEQAINRAMHYGTELSRDDVGEALARFEFLRQKITEEGL